MVDYLFGFVGDSAFVGGQSLRTSSGKHGKRETQANWRNKCRRYYVDVGDRLGLVAPAFRDVLDGEDRGGHGSC